MVRLLAASQLVFLPDWTMGRHVHERFHELIVLTSGAVEARVEPMADDGAGRAAQTVTARAGESLLYARRASHAERSVDHRPVNMVCISFEADDDAFAADGPGPVWSADAAGRVAVLARWMTELTPAACDADQRTLDALLTALLAERSARAREEDQLVQLVRQHVRDHLAERISLGDLADAACLSRFHFARRFRVAAGMSPMAFVRSQRVDAARALLMTRSVPLRAVARTVGLGNEFHLSRVYKRVTGQTPRRNTPGG
ncbi:MAG TPA: AraC family transcriptional regulator [Tepidisphaeraceae bacterium]|nr:AraC family transcriptional regulator [Tepidisphaeraceae bacterium]